MASAQLANPLDMFVVVLFILEIVANIFDDPTTVNDKGQGIAAS